MLIKYKQSFPCASSIQAAIADRKYNLIDCDRLAFPSLICMQAVGQQRQQSGCSCPSMPACQSKTEAFCSWSKEVRGGADLGEELEAGLSIHVEVAME